MSVTVTYSELILAFDIPEELSAKMQELDRDPVIIALTSPDGLNSEYAVLTAQLDGEEYKMSTSLLADERDALEVICEDGINMDTSKVKKADWGYQFVYVEFKDIEYMS